MITAILPISEVIVDDRARKDMGDISSLAESLATYGLIQPLVLDDNKRLIAGERRLRAALSLGWTTIPVLYRSTLTEEERYELELEENKNRKDWDWREECLLITKIHGIRLRQNALTGTAWGQRETASLFKMGLRQVNYTLRLAQLLLANDAEIVNSWSASDAWDVVMRRETEKAQAALARASQDSPALALRGPLAAFLDAEAMPTSPLESGCPISNPSDSIIALRERSRGEDYLTLTIDEARLLYESNTLNDPALFDVYYTQRCEYLRNRDRTIQLSNRLFNTNAIDFMMQADHHEYFSHIITDPPYAIDMDMLDQDANSISDIATTAGEHGVESNKELLQRFFPAAYHCLKPNAYLVLWCDQMVWQYLYDLAQENNFSVQRWPLTWVKTHACINQAAHCNFTKTTEIAMVCRKGTPSLAAHQPRSHILACNDEMKALHPFAKPFDAWQFIISAVSFPKETILDPFAGSGSSIASGLRLDRNMFGCELVENHYNKMLQQVKEYYLTINPNFLFI